MEMRELTNITSIGLNEGDNRVLQCILKIVMNIHDDLNPLAAECLSEADIAFVNGDDAQSLERIQKLNGQVTPIAIVVGTEEISNIACIKRPIVLKRVLQAIEAICSTRSAENTNYAKPVHLKADAIVDAVENKNLLVIDDSFPVRKFMEQKLLEFSNNRARLFFAGNGAEAVKQIKSRRFDVIFLDIVMPDINGYKICKWIKTVQPFCKVIMLSGKKTTIDKVRGSMSGCDAYLTKPPSEQRLQEIYKEYVSERIFSFSETHVLMQRTQ